MKKRIFSCLWIYMMLCLVWTGCGSDSQVDAMIQTVQSSEMFSSEAAEETGQEETESELTVGIEATETELETETVTESSALTQSTAEVTLSATEIPAYTGKPYVVINNNIPQFAEADLTTSSYEYYSELDGLGRCGVVYACIGRDLMPTEERGSIGSVKPTGWHTVKYDVVDGKYLYNRCHLIGYQLSGENANTKNLITGTRYMNVEGMLPFENMVADYVKETGNHVMYRVTPVFEGNNLLASGVQMEARSVEDNGAGILFHVYCYNVQPEVSIDYATGESNSANTSITQSIEESAPTPTPQPEPTPAPEPEPKTEPAPTPDAGNTELVWISATGSKYHSINNCGRMNPNKVHQDTKEAAEKQGLEACSKCY